MTSSLSEGEPTPASTSPHGSREAGIELDIGPDADRAAVKRLLQAGEASDRWGYEESDVDVAWAAQ
ncbi:hypothetical protein [Frondihabitans australicus]|uniref:Uncharacterized protein n=1 Tax=Frondihabitans australicus TaxID=386892 RepID=A0A495IL01_9MICO|nr:hypothetical protein [Frondihabitans australicus]RKR75805.1 hypothetical protein C8E83_2961 [Frondihabitans australicus]